MSSDRPDIELVREAAKRAREEAVRLRAEARALERRLREDVREARRRDHDRRREERRESHSAEQSGANAAEQAFTLEEVRSIVIRQTAGQLVVRPCENDETPGVVTSADRTTPTLSVRSDGDTLNVDVRLAPGWLFRRRKGATTTVRIAPGPDSLRVNVGAGDVQLRGISVSQISIHTGAGVIGSVGSEGDLDLDVGAGKITVYGHRGTVSCATGTGDATVDVAEARAGSYRINVGIGRAELRLPAGLDVHPSARSGLGRGRIEYPDAGDRAPITAVVESGIGEASVRTRANASDGEGGQRQSPPGRSQRSGSETRQSEELRILQLLEQGRISVAEAAELIAALHGASPSPDGDQS